MKKNERTVIGIRRGTTAVKAIYQGTAMIWPEQNDVTRLHFTLTSNLTEKLRFAQSAENAISVDWGDGSSPETAAGTAATINNSPYYEVSMSHTYNQAGNYIIEMTADVGTHWIAGNGYLSFLDVDDEKSNTSPELTAVSLGNSCVGLSAFAFQNCTSLTDFVIPDTVTTISDNPSFNSAFDGCTSLERLYIGAGLSSVDARSFYGCTSLREITVSPANTYFKSIGGVLCSADGQTLVAFPANLRSAYIVPESIRIIGHNAFYSNNKITSVDLVNVTEIKDYAFYQCTNLTNINLSNTAVIEANAFQGCSALSFVELHNVQTINGSAFNGCISIASIDLSNVQTIGGSAFNNCRGITEIIFPTENIVLSASAFSGCSGLTSLIIPGNVSIEKGSIFSNCTGLRQVTLLDGIIRIGQRCFDGCEALVEATFPDSLQIIENEAFRDCGLINIEIGAPTIYGSAFASCTDLESVWIRSTVETIYVSTQSSSGYTNTGYRSPWYQCSKPPTLYCEDSAAQSGWQTGWNVYDYSIANKTYTNTYAPVVYGQTTSPF